MQKHMSTKSEFKTMDTAVKSLALTSRIVSNLPSIQKWYQNHPQYVKPARDILIKSKLYAGTANESLNGKVPMKLILAVVNFQIKHKLTADGKAGPMFFTVANNHKYIPNVQFAKLLVGSKNIPKTKEVVPTKTRKVSIAINRIEDKLAEVTRQIAAYNTKLGLNGSDPKFKLKQGEKPIPISKLINQEKRFREQLKSILGRKNLTSEQKDDLEEAKTINTSHLHHLDRLKSHVLIASASGGKEHVPKMKLPSDAQNVINILKGKGKGITKTSNEKPNTVSIAKNGTGVAVGKTTKDIHAKQREIAKNLKQNRYNVISALYNTKKQVITANVTVSLSPTTYVSGEITIGVPTGLSDLSNHYLGSLVRDYIKKHPGNVLRALLK